jgi:putative ABC transport system substrate-binding protein
MGVKIMNFVVSGRRVVGVAVGLSAVLGLVACGDDDESDSGGTVPSAGTNSPTATGTGSTSDSDDAGPTRTVCVNKFITVSVVDEEVFGFRDALQAQLPDVEFDIQSAEGDAGTNQTISAQFARGGCDLIVAATTPGAQAAAAATDTIPIVFLGVSNPVQAGLVESLDRPGGNITGASDPLPVEAELDAMLQAMPDAQVIGLIWTSGDEAGELHTSRAKTHIEDLGLEAVEAPITTSADASQATQAIAGSVDIIQLPCDATTLSAVPAITAAATEANVPVIGCSAEAVDGGAILSGSYDYTSLGAGAAELAVQIFNGVSPAELAVVVPAVSGFDVNVTKAEELGIVLPEELVENATRTI